jgi:MinD-like ATPase involved in chromosome partitioning or flagellar assembly
MAVLALALDRDTEDRLLADIIEHGHIIVARPANVPELLAAIDRHSPDALIVGATTGTLTAEVLAASDAGGIRVVALAGSAEERRYVADLGLHEVVSAAADWAEVERVLTGGDDIPLRIDEDVFGGGEGERPQAGATGTEGDAAAATARPRAGRRVRRGKRVRPAGRRRDAAEAPPPAGSPAPARGHVDSADSRAAPAPAPELPGSAGITGPGSVIAVWGPAGAPGRTTLAINIAAEIAAAGHTVVLADVDTYSGSIAPSLGLLDEAPGFAAACRLSGNGTLTQVELERIANRYNSPRGAFWVLTGIGRPSRWPELSTERVHGTIDALRDWTDYVVLDTGFSLESDEEISSDLFAPRRNAATLAALGVADTVVACGLADPVGMARFLRAWGDLTEVINTHRVHVVMNRVRPSAVGFAPAGQVQGALRRFGGIEAAALVPHDQAGVDAAVLTGCTLRDAAPRSAARLGILGFVRDELLPAPGVRPLRRSRLRAWRWRGTAPAT